MKIRNNLIFAFVGISLAVSATFAVSQYWSAKGRYEQDLREKLGIISHLASLSLDGNLHKALQKKEDEESMPYREIQNILRDVKKSDGDIAYVYTMRKNTSGSVVFVVDSTEDMENFSHLGDVYEKVTPGLAKALSQDFGTVLENDFYTDKWGTFLSAFTPIVTKEGVADGVVGVDISIEKYRAAIKAILLKAVVLSLFIIVVAALVAFLLAQKIVRPIGAIIPILKEVSEANLSAEVPADLLGRKNEIGELSRSVDTLRNRLREIVSELSDGAGLLLPASANLSSLADELDSNTHHLSSQVDAVTSAADHSTGMVKSIAKNATEVSESMATISVAIDEMNSSLNDINANCKKEAEIVASAESHTVNTRNLMARLSASSSEIGKIVEVITEIAAQTNLLALNATIEASRAGESGKGFAVVANEIKVLARQTADSSRQIQEQITAMQANTTGAVDAIEEITQLIEMVTQSSQIIVAAVREQGTFIGDISRNMASSSQGATAIALHVEDSAQSLSAVLANIKDVHQIAFSTAESVLSVQQSSKDLGQLAMKFEEIVKRFTLGR